MLRIRKIADIHSPAGRSVIAEVQEILRTQFPGMASKDIAKLPEQLANPFRFQFLAELFVAERSDGQVRALAVLFYAPDLAFAFLDVISAAPGRMGGGIGSILYERIREEALALGARGLYFECLPDEPELSPNAKTRAQNAARLKFYERHGARPIAGSAYETPVTPGDIDPPYLVFDGLGRFTLPEPAKLAAIVRAILERKYGDLCPPEYIERVVASMQAPGVALREPRYTAPPAEPVAKAALAGIPLVVNEKHSIHHVRERGYVEAPVRVAAILSELGKTGLFTTIAPKHFGDRHIREVHDGGLVDYIERACKEAPLKRSIYPYVFPVRNAARRPRERSVLAGYWCIDTFTPINRNAYPAARLAVDCTLTAAEKVLEGDRVAYALVRPPGHHAERRAFGGFCYFNNAAVAAQFLSRQGRVAVLDIDYHHGNGTQDIFYERSDVLTVSIHGHPSFAYPYFSGFRDEKGRGPGAGYNLNLPLPESVTPEQHREAMRTALRRMARFAPDYLVLATGFDTAKGDPTGTWSNQAADFRILGRMIGELGLPTLVVQEGGYRVRTLGVNARNFFTGLADGVVAARPARPRPGKSVPVASADIDWRDTVRQDDVDKIRRLVASASVFSSAEVDIAAELAAERVARGRVSGYEFILAERGGRLIGYACYGATPGTEATYDLYWIVVAPSAQKIGLGGQLLARTEAAVAAAGGRHLYIDTSSTENYAPARAFYRRLGFRKVAELADFYRDGDGKVIAVKEIRPEGQAKG